MSAFIVDYGCIDRCLMAVLAMDAHGTLLPSCYQGPPDALDLLGRRLLEMNRRAVAERYPGCDDTDLPGQVLEPGDTFTAWVRRYRWALPRDRDPLAGLKALHCLRYQCTEQSIPDTEPLYGKLCGFIAHVEAASGFDPENPPARYERAAW